MRLLTISSDARGEDWFVLSQKIDELLEGLSMDLAEESVYLIFSEPAAHVLGGSGQCLVARSVIGPKKAPMPPLGLTDWKASPVWMEKLNASSLEDALLIAAGDGRPQSAFFLKIERRLKSELELSIYAIFHE